MTTSTSTFQSRQRQILFGLSIVLLSLVLLAAMVSYYFTWENDQSVLGDFADRTIQTDNIASKFGTTISHFLLYQFIGLGSFVLVFMGLLTGIRLFVGSPWKRPLWIWSWTIASSLWVSLLMSFIIPQHPMLSGMVGVEMSRFTIDYIGDIGLASILIFGCITFMVVILKITPESVRNVFSSFKTFSDVQGYSQKP
ncbi:MAG: DNA translocase FtsK 4TM domain-containing protein, partial [Flavobacteriaceae bacterium]